MRDLCQCVVMEKANVEQAQAGSQTDLGLVLLSQGLTSSVTCFLIRRSQSLLCMVLIKIRENICKAPCLAHRKHVHKTCNEWLSAAKVSLGNLGQCQRPLCRYLFLEKALAAKSSEGIGRYTYESMLRGAPIRDIMPLGQKSFSSKLPRRG